MASSGYQALTNFFVERLERTQTETRTLFESLRGEIRVVADGVLANGRRLDENTRKLGENARRLDDNARRLDENGRRLAENTRRLDENTRAIEANGARIDALSTRLDRLTDRVGGLEHSVSTGFADHEGRLRTLERP